MEADNGVLILIFVVLSLLFGALVKSLPKILTSPYSVLLLVAGLAVGLFSRTPYMQHHYPDLNHACCCWLILNRT